MNFERQISEIRAISKKLLDEGKIDVVLAYADGDLDDGALIPYFARTAEDTDKIKWGDRCWQNLAPYLHGRKDRIAIVAKPCDARAVVQFIIENQIERDNVYIIGMDCPGMIDADGDPRPGCGECKVRVAPVCDTRIVDERIAAHGDAAHGDAAHGDVPFVSNDTKGTSPCAASPFATGSPSGSLKNFRDEIDKCILCYSCRQACYGCYCSTCFIQRDMPDWQPAEIDAGTKMTFHLGRAMHLAGRCVECGACEAACASGVNVRYIIKEATDFIEEMYGFRTGMDFDTTQAMLTYKMDDKEIGFFGGAENE